MPVSGFAFIEVRGREERRRPRPARGGQGSGRGAGSCPPAKGPAPAQPTGWPARTGHASSGEFTGAGDAWPSTLRTCSSIPTCLPPSQLDDGAEKSMHRSVNVGNGEQPSSGGRSDRRVRLPTGGGDRHRRGHRPVCTFQMRVSHASGNGSNRGSSRVCVGWGVGARARACPGD
jgi:hypothetical protein